ncbi:MAG: glycerol-3-phosphate dehydrogenase [Candidatus Binatota bacterium]|jgi:glycerol-3-phosphate dehydrogenase|nr:glycerol-3-phosphate dehydrogenase [Candidatus Binatota bacterium]
MRRDLGRLARETFDVAVVGAGIYGASIARDAALRGLSVAAIDSGDFGHATSANSLKIIHGGLRYLQHLDFVRMRASIAERSILLAIAPHLVRPFPFLMPLYGHGLHGREALWVALKLNDLVSFDRNRSRDPSRRLLGGRVVSREECLRLSPGIVEDGLTGGAIWYDCVMQDSERLLLATVLSAADHGAALANYVEAVGVLRSGDRAIGVRARDRIGGGDLDVRARVVVDAAGPWARRALDGNGEPVRWARAMNVVTRPIGFDHALGVSSRSRTRGRGRLYFLVPWGQRTLIGTAYLPFAGDPDSMAVTSAEVAAFVAEVDAAQPALGLTFDDVSFVHSGLVPIIGDGQASEIELGRRHRVDERADGVVTVTGVKYTTARGVAEEVVDRACARLGRRAACASASTPLRGGDMDHLHDYLARAIERQPEAVGEHVVRRLVERYGTDYQRVLEIAASSPSLARSINGSSEVVGAEIVHAARAEMAVRLSDVVFRRTALAAAGHPGAAALDEASRILGAELGWDSARRTREVEDVDRTLVEKRHARPVSLAATAAIR